MEYSRNFTKFHPMDSLHDPSLKNDLNAPSFFFLVVSSPTTTTFYKFLNTTTSNTCYIPSIPNSENSYSSTSCYYQFQSQLEISTYSNFDPTHPIIQTTQTAYVQSVCTSTTGCNSWQGPYDGVHQQQLPKDININIPSEPGMQYQNFGHGSRPQNEQPNVAQEDSSTPLKKPAPPPYVYRSKEEQRRRIRKRILIMHAQMWYKVEKGMETAEVNLETMKSIGIGPLCPRRKRISLLKKMRILCELLSTLSSERCQLESKILKQDFISKSGYTMPKSKLVYKKLKFIKKCLFFETLVSQQFIKAYSNYLDKEMELNTKILLNKLICYADKLSTLDYVRTKIRRGKIVYCNKRRVIELDQLLSDIILYVRHSCSMFYFMKHENLFKYSQNSKVVIRQCRNIFIG